MIRTDLTLSASRAAARLGISIKTLRHYEARGLLKPERTRSGWRVYGPKDLARAQEIAGLRALGMSLSDIAVYVAADRDGRIVLLGRHERRLLARSRQSVDALGRTRLKVAGLTAEPATAMQAGTDALPSISFELPWPWGGEPFSLAPTPPLTYLVGPLGSGKTRLARRIAEALSGAVYVGLDRDTTAALERTSADGVQRCACVERWTAQLLQEGATDTPALRSLLAALADDDARGFVVDMPEQGLDAPTQKALIAGFRRDLIHFQPLVLLTRSSAILDPAALGPGEAMVFCPANHAPPQLVAPLPGSPGYEALTSCLASPQVRARTEGVIAVRPEVA